MLVMDHDLNTLNPRYRTGSRAGRKTNRVTAEICANLRRGGAEISLEARSERETIIFYCNKAKAPVTSTAAL